MSGKRTPKKKSGGTIGNGVYLISEEANEETNEETKVVDIFSKEEPDPHFVAIGNARPKVFRSEPTLRYALAQKALKRMKQIATKHCEVVVKPPVIEHEEGTTSLDITMEVGGMGGGQEFIENLMEAVRDASNFGVNATTNETVVVGISFIDTHTLELPPWK